jgi:hypothetical protein
MSEAFKPIAERSRWRMIYDLFRKAEINDTVTYQDMADALNLHPVNDRHALQMAARRAGLELEKVDRHAVDPVRGKGYRVVNPPEILGLGRRRNRKAGNQMSRGAITVQAVDLNDVDAPTRQALEILARGFAMQTEINRRIAADHKRHENLIEEMRARQDGLERRIDSLGSARQDWARHG